MSTKGSNVPKAPWLITDPHDMAASPLGDKINGHIIQTLLFAVFVFQSAIIASTLVVTFRADNVVEVAFCLVAAPILPFGVLLVDALMVRQLVEATASIYALLVRALLPVSLAVFAVQVLFTAYWAADIKREQAAVTLGVRLQVIAAAEEQFNAVGEDLAASQNLIVARINAIGAQYPQPVPEESDPQFKDRLSALEANLVAAESEVGRLQSLANCEAGGVADCPEGATTGKEGKREAYRKIVVKLENAVATRDLILSQVNAAKTEVASALNRIEARNDKRAAQMGSLVEVEKALHVELSSIQAKIQDRSERRSEIIQAMAHASPSWAEPADPGLAADLKSLDAIAASNSSVWMTLWAGKIALVAFELSALLAGHGFRHSFYGSRRREALAVSRDRETETTINVDIRIAERLARLADVRSSIRTAAHFARRTRSDFRRADRGWPEWFARPGRSRHQN